MYDISAFIVQRESELWTKTPDFRRRSEVQTAEVAAAGAAVVVAELVASESTRTTIESPPTSTGPSGRLYLS